MMAALFVVFTLAMISIFFQKRKVAISLTLVGLILCLVMLWHHATNYLHINL